MMDIGTGAGGTATAAAAGGKLKSLESGNEPIIVNGSIFDDMVGLVGCCLLLTTMAS